MPRFSIPVAALALFAVRPSTAANADPASAQRGFAVYSQVCSSCHSLRGITFADLADLGLDRTEIRALAASRRIPDGTDPQNHPILRAGLPTDAIPGGRPPGFAAASGQAAPPDLSRLALVLPGGARRIAAILTGYAPPPPGIVPPPGTFYDPAAPGAAIAMPPPLAPGIVVLADGTRPDVPALARDVAAFLDWAAHPHRTARLRLGTGAVLYLLALCVLAVLLKRRVWSNVHR